MKKLFTAIFCLTTFLLIANQGFSQALPNGGMETWITTGSYANPQYWDSPNAATTAIPLVGAAVLTKSNGAHTGSWCAKLQTKNLLVANIPGALVLGKMTIDLATQTGSMSGGAPCNSQVAKITGYYKYQPVSGDTCAMIAYFKKHNPATGGTDTLGFAYFLSNTVVSAWTAFEAPVSWTSIENPDTVQILFASSASANAQANSAMYVDDVALDFSNGISEPLMAEQSNIYFNPATSSVEVHLDLVKLSDLSLRIYNLSGQLIQSISYGNLRQINTSITMAQLPKGMYFIEVLTGNESHSTKIVNY
ncbi:MAG: T9SS type A sorting domain-containing protein [Bacteroidota bacterium]